MHHSKPALLRGDQFICVVLSLCAYANIASANAQNILRVTLHDGMDIAPAWDPRGGSIAYMRSAASSGSGVPFELYQVLPDTPGETVLATGPKSGFGLANSPSWIGSTGTIGLEERVVFHEYLSFDASAAPFTRTVNDGDDAAFTRLMRVPGGGGGGYFKASRDGSTALWRTSSSGGARTQSIRVGPLSPLSGQAADQAGTVIVSSIHSTDQRYLWGAALSPDGNKTVVALPPEGPNSSNPVTDLWLYNSDGSGNPVNLTKTAASGIYNRVPDFFPDGAKVLFSRFSGVSGETWDLYEIALDGSGLTQITDTPNFGEYEPSLSPDGRRAAFRGTHIAGFEDTAPALPAGEAANANIYVMDLPRFEITIDFPRVIANPGSVELGWNTEVGFDYRILESTDLQNWMPVGETIEGDGNAAAQSVAIQLSVAKFFIVEKLD